MDLMTGLFIFYVFCWGVLLCLPEILVFGILAVFWICDRLDEKLCRRKHEDLNKSSPTKKCQPLNHFLRDQTKANKIKETMYIIGCKDNCKIRR